VYRIILCPVYDNEKENRRILINKEIYEILEKPTITETIRLHRLWWFGHLQQMEENRIPKRVLYMNLETRPRDHEIDGKIKCGRMEEQLVEKSGRKSMTGRNGRSS
jgi:hypothetical protein